MISSKIDDGLYVVHTDVDVLEVIKDWEIENNIRCNSTATEEINVLPYPLIVRCWIDAAGASWFKLTPVSRLESALANPDSLHALPYTLNCPLTLLEFKLGLSKQIINRAWKFQSACWDSQTFVINGVDYTYTVQEGEKESILTIRNSVRHLVITLSHDVTGCKAHYETCGGDSDKFPVSQRMSHIDYLVDYLYYGQEVFERNSAMILDDLR